MDGDSEMSAAVFDSTVIYNSCFYSVPGLLFELKWGAYFTTIIWDKYGNPKDP